MSIKRKKRLREKKRVSYSVTKYTEKEKLTTIELLPSWLKNTLGDSEKIELYKIK